MIALVLICCIVATTLAAPQQEPIAILKQSSSQDPEGPYSFNFETANGIKAEETGTLKKNPDPEGTDFIVANGAFSYTDNEGNTFSINYVADDVNGFQPQGAHIPTPPPIPPAIQKALDYIASLNKQ